MWNYFQGGRLGMTGMDAVSHAAEEYRRGDGTVFRAANQNAREGRANNESATVTYVKVFKKI